MRFTLLVALLSSSRSAAAPAPAPPSKACVHVSDLAGYQKVSSQYSISTADGHRIPVEEYQDYHVARLSSSCHSDQQFNISSAAKITSYTVSPLSKHFASSVDKSTGRLLVTLPSLTISDDAHYVVVKINDDSPLLLLLVDRWSRTLDEFQANGRPVLDVSKAPYAADTTGKSEATAAFQQALDDAGQGSVVYVPPGIFSLTHTLNWTEKASGVELFLAPGSVLRTVPDLSRMMWDEKSSCLTLEPMLKLKGPTNIAIRGRGTFDASGKALMAPPPAHKKSKTCTWAYRRHLIDSDYKKSKIRPKNERPGNVTVEGVTLKDATTWTVRLEGLQHLLIRNVKVLNHKNSATAKIGNDGLDLMANRDSVVRKNFVITQDDAMCLKASRKTKEFPFETTCINNTFEGNVVWTACAGAKFGMQARDEMSHSVFRDHDIVHARRGIVVEATSGTFKMGPELVFDDIRIEHLADTTSELGVTTPKTPLDIKAETVAIAGVLVRSSHFEQSVQDAGNSEITDSSGAVSSGAVSSRRRRKAATGGVQDVRFVDLRFGGHVQKSSEQANILIHGNVSGVSFAALAGSLTII